MDTIFLAVITLGAIYFLYKKLFKNNGCGVGCNCGKK